MSGGWPSGAPQRPIICLVTDRRLAFPPDETGLLRTIARAVRAGVTLVHVRERDLDDRRLLALTRGIVEAAAGTAALVVVNDRLDIALAAGAHGVHLRGDSMSAARLRRAYPGRQLLIGQSVHSAAETVAAERAGADYAVFGTVFHTPSKPEGAPVAGLAALSAACSAVQIPVLAIGGVTADKVGAVAGAGAAGFAAIRLFSDVPAGDSDDVLDAALDSRMARIRRAFADARHPG